MSEEKLPDSGQWATFHLAGERYALPVEHVQEVLMTQPLTPVPLAPSHIVGLLNLRGQVMPVVNLRRRLALEAREPHESDKLLVVRVRNATVSLLVDEIGDVLELKQGGWRPIPQTVSGERRSMLRGIHPIEDVIVLGLDSAKLFSDELDEPARSFGARA